MRPSKSWHMGMEGSRRGRSRAVVAIALLAAGCGGGNDRPPAVAEGPLRAVAARIAPCVEDPEAAMAGVSVAQDEEAPNAMIVSLADGARFSVSGGSSDPEALNAEAEALIASCPG